MQTLTEVAAAVGIVSFALGQAMAAAGMSQGSTHGPLWPARLRVEHLDSPRGIDRATPSFSWVVESAGRDQRQTAYHLVAGTDRDAVAQGRGDLWDTGKVTTADTADILYAGRPLVSHLVVYWSVRVWDRDGVASAWAEPATFTVGLLSPDDWTAQWIGHDAARTSLPPLPTLSGANWIAFAGDDPHKAPAEKRIFVGTWTLPADAKVAQAELTITADDGFVLTVNGQPVGERGGNESWRTTRTYDVAAQVHPGDNAVRVVVQNFTVGPTGLIALLEVKLVDGRTLEFVTDGSWRAADAANAPADDRMWAVVKVVGAYGVAPWGNVRSGRLELPPTSLLRTTFDATKPVRRATLYTTALGIADAYVNGKRVSEDLFNPGWTDYAKRVYYRAYDVTPLVRAGRNAVGAELADGWYSGYVGWGAVRDHYGKKTRFAAQLRVEYADGTIDTIATGPHWKASTGPRREADFLMGEAYDARRELPGWATAEFDDGVWSGVDVGTDEVKPLVQWHPSQPVTAFEEFRAATIAEPKPGTYVLDLGQNFAGFVRLRLENTRPGQTVTLRFAERLNTDGSFYVTNLRTARTTDTYVCKGAAVEEWTPRFTFHGFQFVEVSGLLSAPQRDTVVGIAIGSDTPIVGTFDCSDAMLNRLAKNVYYTQRMNFIDIPTDCPQRDERLGWTADAQVYLDAAILWADVQPFFDKWLLDLIDAQRADGQFPMVAPLKVAGDDGGPAWADAGTIVPWTIYEAYGDKAVLARAYPSMRRFVDFMTQRFGDDLLPPEKFHSFGDWLSINADTPHDVFYTAFFAHSVDLTARAADVLGKPDEAKRLRELFGRIKSTFNQAFVLADGKVKGETQTGYVLALTFDLLDSPIREKAAGHLVADVEGRGFHLSTGFNGTKHLLHTLSRFGYTDVAYRLLHNDTFPSWGFTIRHGATSIWERWDGWTPEKGFQDPGMNSFAHYSFGAVYSWMAAHIGGIRRDTVGWKHLTLAPDLDPKLTHATVSYDGPRGRIETAWTRDGDTVRLRVRIPANSTATLVLPGSGEKFELGSGEYEYTVRP